MLAAFPLQRETMVEKQHNKWTSLAKGLFESAKPSY